MESTAGHPLELDEFAVSAREHVDRIVAGGEPILLTSQGRPVALLHGVVPEAGRSGWEAWLSEDQAGSRSGALEPDREPELLDKSLLGFDPTVGTVGNEAGREQLAAELDRLGVPVREEKLLADVYSGLIALCEDKEHIYAEDLRALAQELIAEAPQRLRLTAVTIASSTGLPATAEVTMELGHGPAMRREHGDGPLDAAFKAIQRLTGMEPKVEHFRVVAATPGGDAMAQAFIELNLAGRRVLGTGASTNAVEAGIHAYVNALNFLQEGRAE